MNKNFIKSLTLSMVLLFTTSATVFADMNVSRISGYDRYETTLNANKKYPNSSMNNKFVVISNGSDFKTSLFGSYLASVLDISYFLNNTHGIRTDTLNELKIQGVKKAYIIGDYSLLDKSVDNTLKSIGISVERLYNGKAYYSYGEKSFPTIELQIENLIFDILGPRNDFYGGPESSMLINTDKFPDLLSAIPLASKVAMEQAVFMTNYKNYEYDLSDTNGYSHNYQFGYIIGGVNSVPSNFRANHYENFDGTWYSIDSRIAGKNRYETAVKIADSIELFTNGIVQTVIIVDGENYPDALSSGLVASRTNGAVLLTQPNKLNEDTAKYIKDNNIKNIIIVGGEKSVSRNVENELKKLN